MILVAPPSINNPHATMTSMINASAIASFFVILDLASNHEDHRKFTRPLPTSWTGATRDSCPIGARGARAPRDRNCSRVADHNRYYASQAPSAPCLRSQALAGTGPDSACSRKLHDSIV